MMAAAEGDTPRLERVLDRIFQEGESPVSVVRRVLRHLQRLQCSPHACRRSSGRGGDSYRRPADLLQAPGQLRRQLALWSEPGLRPELDCIAEAELQHEADRNTGRDGLPGRIVALAQAATDQGRGRTR